MSVSTKGIAAELVCLSAVTQKQALPVPGVAFSSLTTKSSILRIGFRRDLTSTQKII